VTLLGDGQYMGDGMITIHHLLASQSERVIWLMEELGLPYALKIYPRDPATNMPRRNSSPCIRSGRRR
jgi:hypothetical protein